MVDQNHQQRELQTIPCCCLFPVHCSLADSQAQRLIVKGKRTIRTMHSLRDSKDGFTGFTFYHLLF
jgi:hypothetical protein